MEDNTHIKSNTTIQKELIEILEKLNISEIESKIIMMLKDCPKGMKQKDICHYGYMYQPEVSKGLKALLNRGWISIIDNVTFEGKGRPYGVYALIKTWDEIIVELKNDVDENYNNAMEDINRLLDLS